MTTEPVRVEEVCTALATALAALQPPAARYWVAFSGGADSHVLLHAMAALGQPRPALMAVHVNHGLQPEAGAWEQHCSGVCRELSVPLEVLRVRVDRLPADGLEAAARRARYDAIAPLLDPGDVLLVAHTLEDQSETLMLQLLRGAGPAGLAAMPSCRDLGKGRIVRPLLQASRAAVHGYAREHGLEFVEDESNEDLRFRRNLIRHEMLPRLREHWPSLDDSLTRVARHQAEALQLTSDLAAMDLDSVRGSDDETLCCSTLRALSPARQRNVLRHWIRVRGLPVPQETHLSHVLQDVLGAKEDRTPLAQWVGAEVRRYRDALYLMRPLREWDPKAVFSWAPSDPRVFVHGRLRARAVQGRGIRRCTSNDTFEVRFRAGGERCRVAGRGVSHTLKALFQEAGLPPWQRERLPLLYRDGRLAAVADRWICEPFQARTGEPGWVVEWEEF